ncbi:hypothetical protein E4U56_005772 [Claviceps arundinis]|uniref:C2H2-type domain-containing protein n=1 Tax=Claviceps arundinis TaxID=1623583 RepID=A0A9P7MWI5_9HYPO|nr:hypothetical protein E4U56_005772 [Claviceps arundinis]
MDGCSSKGQSKRKRLHAEMQYDDVIEPGHPQNATRRKRLQSRGSRHCSPLKSASTFKILPHSNSCASWDNYGATTPSRNSGAGASEKQQDFLCYGELKSNGCWGCGRRFIRLHDFARHLKTPTGRKCIQPLYDEERQMRQHTLTESPTSQLSDDSGVSPSIPWPGSFSSASIADECVTSQAQLQQLPFDFSFTPFHDHQHPDLEGCPSSQMEVNANVSGMCASLSPSDTNSSMNTLGATVPGISYMAWWHSYMGSLSSLERASEFAPDAY